MKYIVSVSGGKDSTACLLYMLERVKKEDVIPVFCDTKWEADVTYEYLDYLEKELEIEIIRLESEGMLNLAKRKKMIPNRAYRFCTYNLKIVPFQKWLKDNFVGKEDFIVVEGIRREESEARANIEIFEIKKSVLKGEKFDIPTMYPIAYWSKEKVFSYLAEKGIKPNPLYKIFNRVGCMPCIFASKYELLYLPEKYKKRLRRLEEIIGQEIGQKAYMFHSSKDRLLEPKLFEFEDLFEGIEV